MPTRRGVAALAVALFIVSIASVWMAYVGCDSRPWQLQFGLGSQFGHGLPEYLPGLLIEIAVSLVVLSAAYLLVGSIFLSEFECLFLGKQADPDTAPFVRPIQWMTIPLILAVTYFVIRHNWIDGPATLASSPEWKSRGGDPAFVGATGESYYRAFARPYRFYLVYSLTNFVFAGCLLAPTAFLAAIRDINRVRVRHDRLEHELIEGTGIESSCEKIADHFREFYAEVIGVIGRYGYFLLAISAVSCFEFYVGRLVLSTTGLLWTTVAIVIMILACLLLFFVFNYFSSAYTDASDLLLRRNCTGSAIPDYSQLLTELRRRYGHLFFLVGGLDLVPILTKLLDFLKTVVLGKQG